MERNQALARSQRQLQGHERIWTVERRRRAVGEDSRCTAAEGEMFRAIYTSLHYLRDLKICILNATVWQTKLAIRQLFTAR